MRQSVADKDVPFRISDRDWNGLFGVISNPVHPEFRAMESLAADRDYWVGVFGAGLGEAT